jgi:hypothetical protein
MKKKPPLEGRCQQYCERRGKGKRYVYARWQCGHWAIRGTGYCAVHKRG